MAWDPTTSPLAWLQSWYRSHCNEEWEWRHGIKIKTNDSPGWVVVIDLAETELSVARFEDIHIKVGEDDWMNCSVADGRFYGFGDPSKLEVILSEFQRWADSLSSARNP